VPVDSERIRPTSGRSYTSLAAGATSVSTGFIVTSAIQRITEFSVQYRDRTLPVCMPTLVILNEA
jgi:hypothetical protein